LGFCPYYRLFGQVGCGGPEHLPLIRGPAPHGAADGLRHGRGKQRGFDGISHCGVDATVNTESVRQISLRCLIELEIHVARHVRLRWMFAGSGTAVAALFGAFGL
jgi:hypothetical protein